METLHATCISIEGKGVLLMGAPGSGKSDLALRLIDEGAMLIADDVVAIEVAAGYVNGNYPDASPHLQGTIEIRGIGLVKVPHRDWVRIMLVIELGERAQRLPERRVRRIAGIEIECLGMNAFEASTPAKIRAALIRERVST